MPGEQALDFGFRGFRDRHAEIRRPIVEARDLGEDLRFGGTRVRTIDQPHGGPTSLGLRFDEDGYSVAYAIDFSELSGDAPVPPS